MAHADEEKPNRYLVIQTADKVVLDRYVLVTLSVFLETLGNADVVNEPVRGLPVERFERETVLYQTHPGQHVTLGVGDCLELALQSPDLGFKIDALYMIN